MAKQILDILNNAPNSDIYDSWARLYERLQRAKRPVCSVSGGADSDIVLYMCTQLDTEQKIKYVYFDTGLEFQATKDHIAWSQDRYGVKIETLRPKKPVPYCTHKYGVPFISKRVSDYIERLQRHDFKWEDKPFEKLYEEYPRCKAALRWWCNSFGENSHFNIEQNKYLKEFMIENPPTFKISGQCCNYAKKAVVHDCISKVDADLNITGIRKSEGGARASAYKSCYSPETDKHVAEFRPIFWYTNETKEVFNEVYGITNSECYEKWGLQRTGCSGCPFARNIELELEAVGKHEPRLHKALMNVFGDSYKYTEEFREYQQEKGIGKWERKQLLV